MSEINDLTTKVVVSVKVKLTVLLTNNRGEFRKEISLKHPILVPRTRIKNKRVINQDKLVKECVELAVLNNAPNTRSFVVEKLVSEVIVREKYSNVSRNKSPVWLWDRTTGVATKYPSNLDASLAISNGKSKRLVGYYKSKMRKLFVEEQNIEKSMTLKELKKNPNKPTILLQNRYLVSDDGINYGGEGSVARGAKINANIPVAVRKLDDKFKPIERVRFYSSISKAAAVLKITNDQLNKMLKKDTTNVCSGHAVWLKESYDKGYRSIKPRGLGRSYLSIRVKRIDVETGDELIFPSMSSAANSLDIDVNVFIKKYLDNGQKGGFAYISMGNSCNIDLIEAREKVTRTKKQRISL